MNSGKPINLAGHVLIRILPAALVLLILFGVVFLHRENTTMEARVSDRLKLCAERVEDFFSEKISAFQGQVRMIAQNDLLANSIIDFQERHRYLPFYFRSLKSIGGTSAEARFSLLDFKGREIISNDLEAGPDLDEAAYAAGIEQSLEVMVFDREGMLFSSPVLIHGFAEGAVSVSLNRKNVQRYFAGIAPPGYGTAVFDESGRIILANSYYESTTGLQASNPRREWVTESRAVDLGDAGCFEISVGMPRRIAYADMLSMRNQMILLLSFAFFAILATIVLATRLTARPVAGLAQEFLEVAHKRDLAARVSIEGPRELQALSFSFNQTMSKLESSHTSYSRLDELLAGSPSVIYTADPRSLKPTFVSVNILELLGFEREQVISSADWWRSHIHPEDKSDFIQRAMHWSAAGAAGHLAVSYRMKRADGNWIWIEDRIKRLPREHGSNPELVGALSDITERKHAEEALAGEAEERRILLDNIITQVWYLTDDHTYGAVNKAHALFNGVQPEDFAFKDMYDIFPMEVADTYRQSNKEVFQSARPVYSEEWVPHVSGERRLISILKSPKLNEKGEVEYVVCSAEDITERRQAENQLNELNATLEQRVEARTRQLQEAHSKLYIQGKMASVGQLAAGLAHEINNPVSFLRINFSVIEENVRAVEKVLAKYREVLSAHAAEGGAPVLEGGLLSAFEEEMDLKFILGEFPGLFSESRDGFDRITEIITSMRNFARKDEPKSFVNFDINTAVRNTLVLARNVYKYSADVVLELEEVPEIPGVAGQINQVLLNLIVNAAQALDEHAEQSGEMGRIVIRTGSCPEGVYCEVMDNGPGIPDGLMESIFDPFFTTKQPGKGMGLGLSISYDIVVNKHDGQMTVNNRAGGGACFRVVLPAHTASSGNQ